MALFYHDIVLLRQLSNSVPWYLVETLTFKVFILLYLLVPEILPPPQTGAARVDEDAASVCARCAHSLGSNHKFKAHSLYR